MTKKEKNNLVSWFVENPGYLKKGCSWIKWNNSVVINYNITDEDIKKCKKEAKIQLQALDNLKSQNSFRNIINKSKLNNFQNKVNDSLPWDNDIDLDKLVLPARKVNIIKDYNKTNNVLIIGDTHLPFEIEGYLDFCKKLEKDYQCSKIIHIGDLVDNHCVSFHDHDPDGHSPGDEYKMALDKCEEWYKAFPIVKICIGNHDRLPFRKAFTAGLPKNWLKSYQEMFNSPNTWKWDFIHREFGVIYQHGTGLSGEMASINAARENRQSTVLGHLHTVCNTRFLASNKDLIFGMNVGCGIDHHKYAFAYGRENTRKPVISAGIVIDGKYPINIPMII
jgi:predicted phosphodiesterase